VSRGLQLAPNGCSLVNGSRKQGRTTCTFVRLADSVSVRSAGFDVTGWTAGELRCDPAPGWNRAGDQIVFPAIANDAGKTRQMFLLRLKE
jgi:hypothetical protein